jgi:hypothetical protein
MRGRVCWERIWLICIDTENEKQEGRYMRDGGRIVLTR